MNVSAPFPPRAKKSHQFTILFTVQFYNTNSRHHRKSEVADKLDIRNSINNLPAYLGTFSPKTPDQAAHACNLYNNKSRSPAPPPFPSDPATNNNNNKL